MTDDPKETPGSDEPIDATPDETPGIVAPGDQIPEPDMAEEAALDEGAIVPAGSGDERDR